MNVISFSKSKQSSAAGSSGGGQLNSINAELKALLDRLGDLKNLEVESLNTYYLDASTANIIDSSITNLNVSTGKFKYIDASLGKFDELDASLMKIDDLDVSLLHSKKILNDSSIVTKELDASIIKSTNIDNLDSIITKNLTVTGSAHFFELIIDQIKSAGGSLLLTPANGFVVEKVIES